MKKLLLLALTVFFVLNFSACGNKKEINELDNKDNSTLDISESSESSEKSTVTSDGNKLYNTVDGEDGSVTVQEYLYDNDVLSEINVTIKLENEDEAKEMYNSIKNGDLKEEYEKKYDNVELNGNCISAEMKEENVEPMKALNQEQMSLILNSSVTTYRVE